MTVAASHYRLAVEMNSRAGARLFIALSCLGLAQSLVSPGSLAKARTMAAARLLRRIRCRGAGPTWFR